MANTYVDYTATAAQTDFPFSFSYLKAEHVKVEINGVDTAAFSIVTSPSNKVVLNSGATAGQIVRVRRSSQPGTNLVDFENGSVLTETELDFAYQHNRFLNEELAELNEASLQIGPGGTDWDAKSNKILNVSTPTLTSDAATKNYVDQKVEQIAAGASTPPSKWQFTGTAGANTTYTVSGADVSGDSAYDVSVNGLVKEPTVDYTVDPDTDTLTIIPSLSGGEDIVIIQRGLGVPLTQGTIGTAQINDGAITTAKILDNAVTSAKILDGSVTDAKLATAPYSHPNHTGDVTSTGDGATVIANNAVTSTKILNGAVTANKISTTDVNFNVSSTGKVGIGGLASSSYKLKVDGDILVNDTADNFPAVILSGSLGSAVQLNDTSTNGQVYNLSSNPDASNRGGFSVGFIAANGTPITGVSHVSSDADFATFSTPSTHSFKVGEYVLLSGAGGNGTWNQKVKIISLPTTSQFQVTKITTSTDYPNTVTLSNIHPPLTIRRHEEASVLYNMIKLLGLPQATSAPAWLEGGQLWIDTTDNSIKIVIDT